MPKLASKEKVINIRVKVVMFSITYEDEFLN